MPSKQAFGKIVDGQWTVTARELKEKTGRVLDHVHWTGEEILITMNGKPYAVLIPADQDVEEWGGTDD